jgi:CTP synthase (UTP-ammonia lyase)
VHIQNVPEPQLDDWSKRAVLWDSLTREVKIAMVGKYTGLSDSYLSVLKVSQCLGFSFVA